MNNINDKLDNAVKALARQTDLIRHANIVENPPVAPVWTIEEAEVVWRILDDHYKNNDNGVHDPLKRIGIDLHKQWTEACQLRRRRDCPARRRRFSALNPSELPL